MEIFLNQPYSFCQKGRRSNQEDARFPNDDRPKEAQHVFVVCDGVGGQDKGEVASRTVADAIGRYMEKIDLSKPFTANDFSKVLDYTYSALYHKMCNDTREMATTMTFVCFNAAGAFCAHMGDSRIYQIRPGVGIMYQSEDHSLVNALVHSGNLTPEEAINHPKSNVITRCISYVEKGTSKPSATTIQIEDVEEGDYFFLCTDGVLHCIDDQELLEILSSEMSDREKINYIAEKCIDSSDNNTAYLIRVDAVNKEESEISESECEYDEEENELSHSSTTARIRQSGFVASEASPDLPKEGNRFSTFIKRLFS